MEQCKSQSSAWGFFKIENKKKTFLAVGFKLSMIFSRILKGYENLIIFFKWSKAILLEDIFSQQKKVHYYFLPTIFAVQNKKTNEITKKTHPSIRVLS